MVKRLKQFLNYCNLTLAEVERAAGLGNGTLAKAVRNNKSIGTDKVEKILLLYPTLSAEWLLRGKGEMLLRTNEEPESAEQIKLKNLEDQIAALQTEKNNYWQLIQKLTEK